jgi:hypothetical protein
MYDCIMSLRGGWAHAPTIKSVHNVHSQKQNPTKKKNTKKNPQKKTIKKNNGKIIERQTRQP